MNINFQEGFAWLVKWKKWYSGHEKGGINSQGWVFLETKIVNWVLIIAKQTYEHGVLMDVTRVESKLDFK